MADEIKKEERLLKVLAIVTDWLKFAEAKNAMLIAFNGASIYGIAKALDLDFLKTNSIAYAYACIVMILLAFSAVISMLSFVPRLSLFSSKDILETETPNGIFFEHLKCQSESEIIQGVCETKETTFSRFENDIASQIKQNSSIASHKYSYFTVAVWITVVAYVTPIIAGIFALITYSHRKEIK